jgi:hypothetical protein
LGICGLEAVIMPNNPGHHVPRVASSFNEQLVLINPGSLLDCIIKGSKNISSRSVAPVFNIPALVGIAVPATSPRVAKYNAITPRSFKLEFVPHSVSRRTPHDCRPTVNVKDGWIFHSLLSLDGFHNPVLHLYTIRPCDPEFFELTQFLACEPAAVEGREFCFNIGFNIQAVNLTWIVHIRQRVNNFSALRTKVGNS